MSIKQIKYKNKTKHFHNQIKWKTLKCLGVSGFVILTRKASKFVTFRSKNIKTLCTWRRYLPLNLIYSYLARDLSLWINWKKQIIWNANVTLDRGEKKPTSLTYAFPDKSKLLVLFPHQWVMSLNAPPAVCCIVSLFIRGNFRQWLCFFVSACP